MSGMHDDQERLTDSLSAYLDGALGSAERDALERHLATCDACRAELAGLRRAQALLRALPEPALPRSFTLPATATTARRSISARRAPGWTRAAQWVGGLAAALGAGLLVAGIIQPPVSGLSSAAATSGQHTATYGGATMAPAPSATVRLPATADSPAAVAGTSIVASPSPTSTATYGPEVSTPAGGATRNDGLRGGAPLVPAGATLLVGGGAALAAGTLSRRRRRPGARR